MDKIFKFSLLKYRPSYLLDEQVNVGVLFLFIEDNKATFHFPKNLERLSALYPDVSEIDILFSLLEFEEKANKLTQNNTLKAVNLNTLIEKEFLIADANCFFFSDFKTGIYESSEKIVSHFTSKYFAVYEQYRQKRFQNTLEEAIKNTVVQLI
jgi:squalene cyclase